MKTNRKTKKVINNISTKLADNIIWVNFKKPARKIITIENIENQNIGEYDTAILVDTENILSNTKSIALAGAVADCAGICSSYNKEIIGEHIGITHAGWQGVRNQVIEQMIDMYKVLVGRKNIKYINFDFSPMAGINYEWEKEKLEEIFKDILKEYKIDLIKDQIFKDYENNPEKGDFILSKLIKRIFLENGILESQLNFHKDETTNLSNKWPSYRIHSLFKKGEIDASFSKKAIGNVIYDSRMGIFNVISKT